MSTILFHRLNENAFKYGASDRTGPRGNCKSEFSFIISIRDVSTITGVMDNNQKYLPALPLFILKQRKRLDGRAAFAGTMKTNRQ